MTAYAGTTVVKEVNPNSGVKQIIVYTQDDADATDTIEVTLADYGISATGLLMCQGFVQTTNSSIVTREDVTSAVSSGVLTITIPSGTDNDVRIILITGLGELPDFTA